jgi:hypothetical protein
MHPCATHSLLITCLGWLLLGPVLLLGACQTTEVAPSRTELLAANDWFMTGLLSEPGLPINDQLVTDLYATRPNCDRDDVFSFRADGTYRVHEGATKCLPQLPDKEELGTWTFNADESILRTQPQRGAATDYRVLEIGPQQLRFHYTLSGANYRYDFTVTYQPRR